MMERVKFGDVVREVKENIDRNTDQHEFYIAGEHMDSENIHITRRGRFEGSDVGPAFIRLFKPGQILYGSRRTYLKKVAVADFEGITSNTTFVLESKDPEKLLQGLLPFIMLTDSFTEYAIKNSKGSTNPYILFSDLAEYEFELPELREQKQLLELLIACDEAKEAYKKQLQATEELVKSQFIEEFKQIPKEDYRPLNDVCTLITDGTHNPPRFVDSGIPFILVSNITGNVVTYDTPKYITEETYEIMMKRTPIEKGDVLLSTVGSYGHPAVVVEDKKFAFQRHVAHLKPNKDIIDSRFLHTAILSSDVQEQIEVLVLGVAQKTLNLSAIKKIRIPVPSLDQQKHFIAFVEQSDKSKFYCWEASNRNFSRCSVRWIQMRKVGKRSLLKSTPKFL